MENKTAGSGCGGWLRLAGALATVVMVLVVSAGLALASDGGGHGGGGMPQLNPATMPTQLFWLIACFGTLYFLLFATALPRVEEVLNARDSRISFDISKADELRNDSNLALAAVERVLDQARSEAHDVLAKTAHEGHAAMQARMVRFELEISRKAKEAEKRINATKAAALSQLELTATDLAAEVTRRLAGIELDSATVTGAVKTAMRERN